MWPIILCSICAAAIVLERLWTLQRKRVLPSELTEQVWKWLSANQVNDKLITALEQNSPLGKVLAVGLANRHRPREVMIERLQDTGRPSSGGVILTASGLTFVGGTDDFRFRAFATATGMLRSARGPCPRRSAGRRS